MGEFVKTYDKGGAPATGSYKAPGLEDQTKKLFETFQKYLPQFTEAQQSNTEKFTPRQNALDYSQYSQYAPLFSQAGNQLQGQEIGQNLSNIQGQGTQLVNAARGLEDAASPAFAAQRDATTAGYLSLLGGMDPNKLSGSEMANVERGVNRVAARTGNLNTGDATSTTSAAMQFGGALDAKKQNFAQALNLFPGMATASKSNMDSFNIGTGKTAAQNVGLQQYGGPQTKFDTQGTDLLGGMRGTSDARYNQLAGRKTQSEAYSDISGSSCYGCYIFKEVFGYPDAPYYIRMCRDFFYKQDQKIAKGYRRMSYWLVPMMQQSRIVRYLATWTSIMPLNYYGQYLTGQKNSNWKKVFKPVAKFWLKVWSITGK